MCLSYTSRCHHSSSTRPLFIEYILYDFFFTDTDVKMASCQKDKLEKLQSVSFDWTEFEKVFACGETFLQSVLIFPNVYKSYGRNQKTS